MLILPSDSENGLIYTLKINGKTHASSTNENKERHKNPIAYNVDDRWCSGPSEEEKSEWWEVELNHYIYPTNYSIHNSYNLAPISWKLEGKYNDEWKVLSEVINSNVGNNAIGLWEIRIYPGMYFNTFRFSSIKKPIDITTNYYHFCLQKIDFFGSAIPICKPNTLCKSTKSTSYILFSVLISYN